MVAHPVSISPQNQCRKSQHHPSPSTCVGHSESPASLSVGLVLFFSHRRGWRLRRSQVRPNFREAVIHLGFGNLYVAMAGHASLANNLKALTTLGALDGAINNSTTELCPAEIGAGHFALTNRLIQLKLLNKNRVSPDRLSVGSNVDHLDRGLHRAPRQHQSHHAQRGNPNHSHFQSPLPRLYRAAAAA